MNTGKTTPSAFLHQQLDVTGSRDNDKVCRSCTIVEEQWVPHPSFLRVRIFSIFCCSTTRHAVPLVTSGCFTNVASVERISARFSAVSRSAGSTWSSVTK